MSQPANATPAEREIQNPGLPGKVLLVGPMPAAGQYVGGIAVLLSQILESWDLPYNHLFFNTEGAPRDYSKSGTVRLANITRFFRNTGSLLRLQRRERPGVVHYHTSRHLALLKDLMVVWLLKRLGRAHVLGHVHWASYDSLFVGRSRLLHRLQLRLMLRAFDTLILMSQSIREELAACLPAGDRRFFESKAKVLHNFTRLPALASNRAPAARPVTLFFIGNIGRRKGAFDLVAAARRLRGQGLSSFQVVLAGPCDNQAVEKELRDLIAKEDLTGTVRLAGPVSGEAKDLLFRQADIFVLPSYGEGLPMSLLEALSYAVPAVTTSVGGIPEVIVDGQSGFLVRPGDLAGLCHALTTLICSPELRENLGQRGRALVEQRHTPQQYLRSLEAIYREALAAGP